MLRVYSRLNRCYYISIPDKIEELSIYTVPHGTVTDLVFETPFAIYIFKNTTCASSVCECIMDTLDDQMFQYIINVDLDKILGIPFEAQALEIISKSRAVCIEKEDYEELPF